MKPFAPLRTIKPFTTLGILAAFLALPALVGLQAATVTWDGNGTPDASGLWETGVNWSSDAIPTSADNASLLNVTSGTRTVTISSGSPQTINKLTITQTTVGAVNALTLNDNLTISTSGANSPFALTATAGQSSIVTTIAAGKTLLATNSNSGMTGTTFAGTLNLGAGSIFRLEALGGASNLVSSTFGGPINATGAGATIALQAGLFLQNPVFNGPITVSGAGSTFTLSGLAGAGAGTLTSVGGSLTFNGNDGSSNSVNVTAGTGMTFNAGPSTYNFTNRVNVAAGAPITFGSLAGGSNTQTANFNGGLVLGAGATATVNGPTARANLAGTSSLGTGASLKLATDANSGNYNLANSGNFTMDGAAVTFDLASAAAGTPSSSTIGRRFVNTGTWTLQNNSSMKFISTTGRPTSGFGIGTNNENSGTFNVKSGSVVGFDSLYNTGTMNLGSSTAGVSDALVTLGSPDNTFTAVTLNNGLTAPLPTSAAAPGTINILGNTLLGRTIASGATTLNNGTASSTGSSINVGDGTVPATFTVSNQTVAVNNFAGNTINLNAGASLLLRSATTGFTSSSVALTNSGTMKHAGTLLMQGNFFGTRDITVASTGVYRISGTAARIEALAGNGSGSNVTDTRVLLSGQLSGASADDRLTYVNSTGAASRNYLVMTATGAKITPGLGSGGVGTASIGSLDLVDTNLSLSAGTTMTFDIGGTQASGLYDELTLTLATAGAGAQLNLGSDSILDINLVNGFTLGGGTYQIIGATSVTGTFGTLLFNGVAMSGEYSVDYLANGVAINLVPEPSVSLLLGGTLMVIGLRRRNYRKSC